MADNFVANAGAGGSTFAADDITGVLYPRTKITLGADGVNGGDVSAANPLPVSGTFWQASQPVTLASTTVTGSVAVTGAFFQASQPVSGTFWQATQPVSIAATVAVSGPLTDTQLRLTAVPVSLTSTTVTGSVAVTGTFFQATQPVSGPLTDAQLRASAVPVSLASTTVTGSVAVTGPLTDTQLRATPVPVSGTVAVTGALTDTQLRASAVPVSLASTTVTGSVAVTGTFFQATQPVSAASLPLPAGAATEATLAARIPANGQALMAASVPVVIASNQAAFPVTVTSTTITGTVAATQSGTWNIGSITTLPALATGANVIGAVTQSGAWTLSANQSVNIAQINGVAPLMGNGVTGTGSQRVTIASDQTAFSVNAIQATLTKGTQGATGVSTQDLKDAGRAIVNAATAIAGVTAVTTEALLTLSVSRDCAATSAVTTIAVTSGKRLRILGVTCGVISTGAAVISARVSLRMNPAGVAAATSPIICTLSLSQKAAALAQAGDSQTIMFPEAVEISGTMQVGLSQVASAITGTIWASLIAYEY